jgi:exopolysaccharide biosynthesis polyprenyl glycosylphosphotransferase
VHNLCKTRGVSMRIMSRESDLLFSKVGLHDIAGIPVFVPEGLKVRFLKKLLKRAFDIIVSSLMIIIFSPVFLVVAVAIKLESEGPVFFRHRRSLGASDESFGFLKFRSMHDHADTAKESLLERNESDGALFKIKDDPRLTRVGKVIRKFSIDELPQLVNVLKGEMSLVGPRPLPVNDYAHLDRNDHVGGYVHLRSKVKPGMTGLWQVSGRSNLGFRDMVMLDLYYIENQTILFDLEILAQTVPVVLFGRGAY